MRKNKADFNFSAVVDDAKASPFMDLQNRLDKLQDNGMTALTIRTVLFNKMLDMHSVPADHFLRKESAPSRLDDPRIIETLNELGFYKQRKVIH
jgi:hypothetical protein